MLIKRKEFIQVGSLATASLLLPRFLKAFERPAMVPPGNKVLVVLQLSGGNDGLNTVIPVRNDLYYKARPRLGIAAGKALSLTDEAGLHPALTAFKSLYDEGQLGILNSVGYGYLAYGESKPGVLAYRLAGPLPRCPVYRLRQAHPGHRDG